MGGKLLILRNFWLVFWGFYIFKSKITFWRQYLMDECLLTKFSVSCVL